MSTSANASLARCWSASDSSPVALVISSRARQALSMLAASTSVYNISLGSLLLRPPKHGFFPAYNLCFCAVLRSPLHLCAKPRIHSAVWDCRTPYPSFAKVVFASFHDTLLYRINLDFVRRFRWMVKLHCFFPPPVCRVSMHLHCK